MDLAKRSTALTKQQVLEDLAIISKIATKSKNLKGTLVRELKDAAVSIATAVEVLGTRTITEETRQLQADNARLQTEMDYLRREVSILKEDMERARKQGCPAPSPTDSTEVGGGEAEG